MALTASQLTSIRNQIGDINDDDYDLSDDRLNELFGESGVFGDTLVLSCWERMGILANEIDTGGQGQVTERRQQRYENLEKICTRLAKQYGLDGGTLTVGTLDLNLDTDSEDVTT
jgi:hypothetical protein